MHPHPNEELGRDGGADKGRRPFRSTRQRRMAIFCSVQLPVIIWAACAYLLGSHLFGLGLLPSLALAAGCAYVIGLVEQMVLATPRTPTIFLARFVLTILMSALGACVFDLAIFEKDAYAHLRKTAASAYVQSMQPEIDRKSLDVVAKKKDWEEALKKANCEADKTCGSRLPGNGRIFRELKHQADQKREDYRSADSALDNLKKKVKEDTVAVGEQAAQQAGVLQRLQALHQYIAANPAAMVGWAALFLGVMMLEASPLLAKYACGETTEEKLHCLREAIALQRLQRYGQMPGNLQATTAPRALTRALK